MVPKDKYMPYKSRRFTGDEQLRHITGLIHEDVSSDEPLPAPVWRRWVYNELTTFVHQIGARQAHIDRILQRLGMEHGPQGCTMTSLQIMECIEHYLDNWETPDPV